jgi:N-acetylglucosamine malate deacetylase 1
MPSALAIFAHPDDIEFVAAGTLLMLAERGWQIHYFNLCDGCCGSVHLDARTAAAVRLAEARQAASLLGAVFHPPICHDLELTYTVPLLRKVAAVVRESAAEMVLTHSPLDYMEDHMAACRLAVTAAFAQGIPNLETDPPRAAVHQEVTVYHAMPHGLRDPLRQRVRAGSYVDTGSVHELKRVGLAAHASQKDWLDASQGMDSYLDAMDGMSRDVGRLSGRFQHAEGWRRHLHLGLGKEDADPLKDALGAGCHVDPVYEQALDHPDR